MHSDEFKADAVAACMQPGMSMAAVAMARGINANLLRRWVQDSEAKATSSGISKKPVATAAVTAPKTSFIPMTLPTPALAQPADIRIELQRGATAITVTWPAAVAAECAAWMRELLR